MNGLTQNLVPLHSLPCWCLGHCYWLSQFHRLYRSTIWWIIFLLISGVTGSMIKTSALSSFSKLLLLLSLRLSSLWLVLSSWLVSSSSSLVITCLVALMALLLLTLFLLLLQLFISLDTLLHQLLSVIMAAVNFNWLCMGTGCMIWNGLFTEVLR